MLMEGVFFTAVPLMCCLFLIDRWQKKRRMRQEHSDESVSRRGQGAIVTTLPPLQAINATQPSDIWIDRDDFTCEETWRLLRWCRSRGADEFTIAVYGSPERRIEPFALPSAVREHLGYGRTGTLDLYRLDDGSVRVLEEMHPRGLFQSPNWVSDSHAEDLVIFRDGQPILWVISHEGFGGLRVSSAERDELASMGVREGFVWAGNAGYSAISFGPAKMEVAGYEFPNLSGGPEDDWLRVHFSIESIPRVFVRYHTLDATAPSLLRWQEALVRLSQGALDSVTMDTTRPGLSLHFIRRGREDPVRVVVDGRQMAADFVGHFWEFELAQAALESMAAQCGTIIREVVPGLPPRPRTSIPGDGERETRASRRRLLEPSGHPAGLSPLL